MEIRAYDEAYLDSAQYTLGHAVDFAVMTLGVAPDAFGGALAVSRAGKQFAAGNPRYVAGMSGCEFAREVLVEVQMPFSDAPDAMYLDKSPEYWAGWALAFSQWASDRSFMELLRAASLEEIVAMYPVYHEMDVWKFAERMDEAMQAAHPRGRLFAHRTRAGLTQAELARASGVPLRQIQLFEQGRRAINRTGAETLYRLAKALCVRMEDLMEPQRLAPGMGR